MTKLFGRDEFVLFVEQVEQIPETLDDVVWFGLALDVLVLSLPAVQHSYHPDSVRRVDIVRGIIADIHRFSRIKAEYLAYLLI